MPARNDGGGVATARCFNSVVRPERADESEPWHDAVDHGDADAAIEAPGAGPAAGANERNGSTDDPSLTTCSKPQLEHVASGTQEWPIRKSGEEERRLSACHLCPPVAKLTASRSQKCPAGDRRTRRRYARGDEMPRVERYALGEEDRRCKRGVDSQQRELRKVAREDHHLRCDRPIAIWLAEADNLGGCAARDRAPARSAFGRGAENAGCVADSREGDSQRPRERAYRCAGERPCGGDGEDCPPNVAPAGRGVERRLRRAPGRARDARSTGRGRSPSAGFSTAPAGTMTDAALPSATEVSAAVSTDWATAVAPFGVPGETVMWTANGDSVPSV